MTPEYAGYLAHYGVKGQKWGVRRYQNEDGTLNEAGRQRYGNLKDRGDSGLVRKTVGGEYGNYAFAKWRSRRHEKNLAKAQASGDEKKIEKYQSKKNAQDAANANLDAYRRHTKASKLIAQNMLLPVGSSLYRHARARGESRGSALIETFLAGTVAGSVLRMHRDKKAYGKRIVWADSDGTAL